MEGHNVSVEGLKKHYKEHQIVLNNLCKLYKSMDATYAVRKNVVLSRLVSEIGAHFKYLCYFSMSQENYSKIKDFYVNLKKNYPEILQIVLKKKFFVKLFVYTNGFAYPLMRLITILYLKGLLNSVLKLKNAIDRL